MQGEEIFQPIPEWAWFSQGDWRKRKKNHVTLTQKLPWKSCFTTHLPFLSSNSKILKAFPKTIPSKVKLNEFPAKEKKKWGKKSEFMKRRGKKNGKKKVKTAVPLFNPKTILKFCFLRMLKVRKLTFCIWIRRLGSVWPVNSFVVSFT